MNRDLIAYLPPFLARYTELSEALGAEGSEFDKALEKIGRILDNEFIETADEYGVSRFENMLGIAPSAADTLNDRRQRVLAKFNENLPYTLRSLNNILNNVFGTNGYVLEFLPDKYAVKVKIALSIKARVQIAEDILERMIPCNMLYSVELLFNTWRLVNKYKWSAVKKYSWRHIKQEVLI